MSSVKWRPFCLGLKVLSTEFGLWVRMKLGYFAKKKYMEICADFHKLIWGPLKKIVYVLVTWVIVDCCNG